VEQQQPEAGTSSDGGMRARWAALDPEMRRRIVWITTLVIIVLIVVAIFALGFAGGRCKGCG
jgi:hypothetical protein